MQTLEYTVGRFLCGKLRGYLERMRFLNPELRFHEGRGWITRTFIVMGPPEVLRQVSRDMADWEARMSNAGG